MTEERRSHVTVELKNKRLGMYLEPVDDDNRGAVLMRFEPIDGAAGEAEASGLLRSGMTISHINDSSVSWTQFPSIISTLVNCGRPVRITFKDPDVHEYRDSYNFLRHKLYVDREAKYLERIAEAAQAHDKAWLALLVELGGKRGASFGVQRLMRDACGDMAFPEEPSMRLNAMSPIHGRMVGLSSSDVAKRGGSGAAAAPAPAPAPAAAAAAAAPASPARATSKAGSSNSDSSSTAAPTALTRAAPGSATTTPSRAAARQRSGSESPPETPGERAAREERELHPAAVVVSIFKRCWHAGTIGVPVPPGLSVKFPGNIPPPKLRGKLMATVQRLIETGGIPAAFRPTVWWELSGAHAKAALHPPGYYVALASQKASNESAYAILKDLDRTFPGHPFFESKAGVASLHRLLLAFSVHNPDIGYCQSINFLAGFLLLLMMEEQAFWVLETVVTEIFPPDYYHNALLGVHADQRVLAHFVAELLPEVAEAFDKAGMQLHLVTVEWFLAAMCTVLPTHTALRVWDALFWHGSEVLFRIALVLFLQHKDRILSVAASSTKSNVVVRALPSPLPGDGGAGGAGSTARPAPLHLSSGGGSGGGAGLASPPPTSPTVVVASASTLQQGGSTPAARLFSLGRPRDTVAETASKVLAAAAAAGVTASLPPPRSSNADTLSDADADGSLAAEGAASPLSSGGLGTPPRSAAANASAALARGGTVRSPLSTFPALFAMLKAMPQQAHAADELFRLAYPQNAKEAKATLDWPAHLNPQRLAKLRHAARAAAEKELDDFRPAAAPTAPSSSSSESRSASAVMAAITREPVVPSTPAPAAAAQAQAQAQEETEQEGAAADDGTQDTADVDAAPADVEEEADDSKLTI